MQQEKDISFQDLFFPFTPKKAMCIFIVIGAVVFLNMLFNSFAYDDIKYIQNNVEVHAFSLSKIIGPSLFNGTGQYRPIPALYYTALYGIFNNFAFFYHIIQLALHIGISIIVFILFKKFFPFILSFFVALIFLVHPMQVESVSYISSFDNILFFLFGIIALFICFSDKLSLFKTSSICVFLFLSFLTKETGFLFFPLVIFYSILFQKKHIGKTIIAGSIAVASYFFIRFGIAGVPFGTFDTIPMHQLTLIERLMNAPAIFSYYLNTFFFPQHLAILQNWKITYLDAVHVIYPLFEDSLFIASIFGLGIYIFKTNKTLFKVYLFFTVWFFMGIGLHLQVIPLDMTVADRWFYFPMVGLLGILSSGLFIVQEKILIRKNKKFAASFSAVFIILIILLSLRTIIRNTNWHDEKTLLIHDIPISDDFSKEDMLALDYLSEKKYDEALTHMKKSVALNPVALNINNLGLIYQLKGDYHHAQEMYEKSLQFKESSNSLFAYINLSYLYVYHGNPNKAIPIILHKILPTYPKSADFWLLLSVAEYKLHNQEKALDAIKKAYALSPTQNISDMYTYMMQNGSAEAIQLNNPSFFDHIQ